MREYYGILSQNIIFHGLNEDEMEKATAYFGAKAQSYRKGEFLHHYGEPLKYFGAVLAGTVYVCTDDIEGRQMMMASASAGDCFGESLCFLRVPEAPVYIIAAEDCTVMWLSADRLHDISKTGFEHEMKERFITDLAGRTLSMNSRIQTLSKHSIREKIMMLLTGYVRKNGDKPFSVPFDRNGMAVYLGVDRSALSRELSAMKREGIIDYNKNVFRFLGKHCE